MRGEDERDLFAPANGIRARWRYAYDLVTAREPGDSITLEQLAEALDMDYHPRDEDMRRLLFQVMDTARAHLEENGERTVGTKEKYGWIVLDSAAALRQSEARMGKVRRAAVVTARSLGAVRREELTQQQRQERDFLAGSLMRVSEVMGGRKRKAFRELNQKSKEIEGR